MLPTLYIINEVCKNYKGIRIERQEKHRNKRHRLTTVPIRSGSIIGTKIPRYQHNVTCMIGDNADIPGKHIMHL